MNLQCSPKTGSLRRLLLAVLVGFALFSCTSRPKEAAPVETAKTADAPAGGASSPAMDTASAPEPVEREEAELAAPLASPRKKGSMSKSLDAGAEDRFDELMDGESFAAATSSGPREGGLKAGYTDDHRQYNYFLDFLERFRQLSLKRELPVANRVVFEVQDRAGRPFPNVELAFTAGNGEVLDRVMTNADGRAFVTLDRDAVVAARFNNRTLIQKPFDSQVTSLNPKPGNSLGGALQTAMNNITPDFLVDTFNGQVTIHLNNSNIPSLKVNNSFSEMLKGYQENKESMSADDKQAILFMKQKVDSAKWFIDAVKQRQNTLQRTMEAIVNLQYDFFLNEDESQLKPMVLKDVAERTGFDISTVSRVSNSKYVQTNNGIYPLKYFFSEAMQTSDGEDISSREVKKILKESIDAENPTRPLTDDQLTQILNEKGYLIARRTVAKYREQLNIPVSRLRKKI